MTATGRAAPPYAVVVPTLGRPSLHRCLAALAASAGPKPARVVIVHDRPGDNGSVPDLAVPEALRPLTTVVPGRACGPAAARNTGTALAGPVPWIVFLDDDVVPSDTWAEDLARDLASASDTTAAVTARIDVPLPEDRRPTDWERNTAGLATARWITADMAFRRAALDASGGFDERFRRAYREDADLALRLLGGGWTLAAGTRRTTHPVRPADRWISVRQQAGNADDVLMTRLHGPDWRYRAGAPRGRFPRHLAVAAAGVAALGCAAFGSRKAAAVCGALWLTGTAEFAVARVAPGPRTREEISRMLLTSAVIPPAAAWHRLRGHVVHRGVRPLGPARPPDVRPATADASRAAEVAS
ncbi:glycosyltransferase [Streptomyces sp. ISL-36]|uniref:glycosyltransferase family 2 protein n=1 Tax=Streptomyces sp. ISL-36 TaxID=2819182 RepID=UPI001BE8ED40|nr:glycosyltransferase [Streptomyces sp. ISL-36]MBT2442015.1 glycosyltransferase [Streptomyces sp. ISL-36]